MTYSYGEHIKPFPGNLISIDCGRLFAILLGYLQKAIWKAGISVSQNARGVKLWPQPFPWPTNIRTILAWGFLCPQSSPRSKWTGIPNLRKN
jgi:hypothetical protein